MRKRILIAVIALRAALASASRSQSLLYTETGLALVAGQLHRLERWHTIEGVSGTIAGPLRVARFELSIPRLQVVSHDIVIDLELRGLLLQTVQTQPADARAIRWSTLRECRNAADEQAAAIPATLPAHRRARCRPDAAFATFICDGTAVDAQRVQRSRHDHFTTTARTQFKVAGRRSSMPRAICGSSLVSR